MKNYSENNIDAMYESYFKDANQFELISRKKEKELAAKIQAGCEESLNDLIQANLKLVITIAHKFSYQKCDFMDLISEGNIGLRKAALKFDPIKAPDARFSTYASWWIKQRIRRYLKENLTTVRVPINTLAKIKKVRKMTHDFAFNNDRQPNDQEICEACEITMVTLRRLRPCLAFSIEHLDELVKDTDDNLTKRDKIIGDYLTDNEVSLDEKIETEERMSWLMGYLSPEEDNFSERNCKIFKMRYGLPPHDAPHTLEDVSQEHRCTRERVRQICEQMIRVVKFQGKERF